MNYVDLQPLETCPVTWKEVNEWSQEYFKRNTKALQAGETHQSTLQNNVAVFYVFLYLPITLLFLLQLYPFPLLANLHSLSLFNAYRTKKVILRRE